MSKISDVLNLNEVESKVTYYTKESGEPEKSISRNEFLNLCKKFDNELEFVFESGQRIFAGTYDFPVLCSQPMGKDNIQLVVVI